MLNLMPLESDSSKTTDKSTNQVHTFVFNNYFTMIIILLFSCKICPNIMYTLKNNLSNSCTYLTCQTTSVAKQWTVYVLCESFQIQYTRSLYYLRVKTNVFINGWHLKLLTEPKQSLGRSEFSVLKIYFSI